MANHEHEMPTQSLVPARRPGEEGHLASMVGPYASPSGISRSPEVVSGGVDPINLWHAFRRRWLLATLMGLLLASLAAVGLYFLFPVSNTAMTFFAVRSERPTILSTSINDNDASYDVYRATVVAYMRSPRVLNEAINDARIRGAAIPFLDKEQDKVAFLQQQLVVNYQGDSEILNVGLSLNEEGQQLKKVVDSVADAYQSVVLEQERIQRASIRDALGTHYREKEERIRGLLEETAQMRKDLGLTEGSFDAGARLIMNEYSLRLKARADAEKASIEAYTQYMLYQNMRGNKTIEDAKIEAQLAADPNLGQLNQEIMIKQYQLRQLQQQTKRESSRQIDRVKNELVMLQQQLNQYKAQMKAQLSNTQTGQPDPELAMMELQFRTTYGLNQQRILALDEQIAQLKEVLSSKSEKSTDLFVREAELEQEQIVAQDLAQRIDTWDIELGQNTERVSLIEPAVIIPGINRTQQYAIAGAGALGTFGLVCLGIAYLEFMNRKLNGPKQIDEGLGIRVLGILPGLGGRKTLNPKHPLVAQLTESVDSVRTALMHEATSKQRQVVLVTSPAAKEGRTTVASQLAVSLARAGRRTLLIDADIRSPSLHRMFDLPLEDGLCEVLRAESDVSDVINPTQADGMWLLTAGYCDADAVHAMATDQIQPIFEKLRADYDFIIIDGAPVLGISDSLMIGQHCDGAILSVLRDQTQVPKIYQAAELLRSVGIRLIGSVVNGVNSKADRRVTRLRTATPKAERKQLESAK